MIAIQILLALTVPAAANWAAARFKLAKLLGPVVLCYGAGILFGNVGLPLHTDVSETMVRAAVPIAIPLLLYSCEVTKWLSLARSLLISFTLACISAVASAAIVGWMFKSRTDEWWKIAGMLVGVYVGGTANMNAVGRITEVRNETFLLVSSADLVTGGVYLLLLLSVGQRVALWFLKPFVPEEGAAEHVEVPAGDGLALKNLKPLLLAFGLTVVIAVAAAGLSLLITGGLNEAFVLVALTLGGIGASLSPKVRNLAGAYDLGEYSLFIFCFSVGSMADVTKLAEAGPTIFALVLLTMCLAIAMHVASSRLFGIDADTTLICNTATIFGPAFIGPVASSLKNRQLVGPGLTLGLAGIALGTLLGSATSWALKALAGP